MSFINPAGLPAVVLKSLGIPVPPDVIEPTPVTHSGAWTFSSNSPYVCPNVKPLRLDDTYTPPVVKPLNIVAEPGKFVDPFIVVPYNPDHHANFLPMSVEQRAMIDAQQLAQSQASAPAASVGISSGHSQTSVGPGSSGAPVHQIGPPAAANPVSHSRFLHASYVHAQDLGGLHLNGGSELIEGFL